ncbi:hypothetical protein MMC06_003161 [Schaereria dolodes]|nr:hypothetical protein [Schaereria dolodes]
MSSDTIPISPARFAAALPALPLSSLHAKATELSNSITHLEQSNKELEIFANDGDKDCAEAIGENKDVIVRMEERIALLKAEVEDRGYLWDEQHQGQSRESCDDGEINGLGSNDTGAIEDDIHVAGATGPTNGERRGGRLGDQELAQALQERMDSGGDEDESGVHL